MRDDWVRFLSDTSQRARQNYQAAQDQAASLERASLLTDPHRPRVGPMISCHAVVRRRWLYTSTGFGASTPFLVCPRMTPYVTMIPNFRYIGIAAWFPQTLIVIGGADGTRTRDPRRDRL